MMNLFDLFINFILTEGAYKQKKFVNESEWKKPFGGLNHWWGNFCWDFDHILKNIVILLILKTVDRLNKNKKLDKIKCFFTKITTHDRHLYH